MQEAVSGHIVGNIEHGTSVNSEYRRAIAALNRTGVLSILPRSEKLGVIGVDGKEYPVPTEDEINKIFEHNRKLVEVKKGQGFTKLQLTPLAVPIPLLIARTEAEILKHEKESKIFQTKKHPDDPNIPTRVDTNEPVWVWNRVKDAISSDSIVYFPRQFEVRHKGKTKTEVINDPKVCAVPGWSVGLVEDMQILPQQGGARTINGRKQLENNLSPEDYLKILKGTNYKSETGWTYEDFLADFLVNLHNTNQVSNEYYENSAVWLVGSYLSSSAGGPGGRWFRGSGRLDVGAGDPGDRGGNWGVRSTVRLGL